ncbi:MAG: hypothetical protein H6823_13490 [Planctomycetaceae bacterium]|nr:hypothetical protein [Planctomycetaceae bacterium]
MSTSTLLPTKLVTKQGHGQLRFKAAAIDAEVREYHEDQEFKHVEDWIVNHFAGLGSDCLVDWDNRQPYYGDSGLIAEHTIPTSTRKASIRIARLYPQGGQGTFRGIDVKPGTAIASEAVLSSLVFELLNVSNHRAFSRITNLARDGELSRSEYVTEMFHAEFGAIHQLQEFYATVYLPWVRRANTKTNPVFWYASSGNGEWEMAETILDRYAFTAWYPWGLFSEAFDGIRQSDGALPRKPRSQCNCGTSRITSNPLNSPQ